MDPQQQTIQDVMINEKPISMTRQIKITLMIIFFSVFLDCLGVSIIQPILPFYAKTFNANSTQLGALYSSYYIMSLLASIFMGKCSDIVGRKPMVLFSLFGTCIGFLLCGLANNYQQLLAFRFILGFFGSTIGVGMAVITDSVPSISRSKYLAATGAVTVVAHIIGPGIGAGFAEFGIRVPFFISSGSGAVGFIFALIFLKETSPRIQNQRYQQQHDEVELDNYKHKQTDNDGDEINVNEINVNETNVNETKIPIQVWMLCIVYIVTTLSFAVYVSMFALYVIDVYKLSTLYVGYINLSVAVIVVFSNIVFVKGSKYIGTYTQTIIACFLCGIALFFMPLIENLWIFLAVLLFGFGLGMGQIYAAMSIIPAALSSTKNRGIILGLVRAACKVSLIIGPLVHGAVYQVNQSYPWFVGSAASFSGGFLMIVMLYKWPQKQK